MVKVNAAGSVGASITWALEVGALDIVMQNSMTIVNALSPGLIFQIAAAAGIELRGSGAKRSCRCPFHEDRNSSAFVSISNVFYCSVCSAGQGWSAKRFSEELDLPWPPVDGVTRIASPRVRQAASTGVAVLRNEFTPEHARATWNASFARARDEEMIAADAGVHDYVSRRRLGEALELGAYGVLPTVGLHTAIAWWPQRGYRVVAPLFDLAGNIVSLQARAIVPRDLKVMNPQGARIAGTVFADRSGQRVLRGSRADLVVFGEGLTDMLALAIASPWPVITVPGTGNACNAVGSWANGADVLLALDCDVAGEKATGDAAPRLYEQGARSVRRVRWPSGIHDACDFIAQRGDEALHKWLVRKGSAVGA